MPHPIWNIHLNSIHHSIVDKDTLLVRRCNYEIADRQLLSAIKPGEEQW